MVAVVEAVVAVVVAVVVLILILSIYGHKLGARSLAPVYARARVCYL